MYGMSYSCIPVSPMTGVVRLNNNDNNADKKNHTNDKKIAVALSYDPNEVAPKIIASGRGYLADKITNKAQESDIPIYKDESLANTLSRMELGSHIPPELYEVVSEILLFVDRMDRIKNKIL